MKLLKYITILFSLLLFINCKQNRVTTDETKQKIKLSFQIIPEDFDKGLYYVEWEDTLGLSEGYLEGDFAKRPKEIWCVITNDRNDTLGYYRGLSTAQTFSPFQSIDSVVILNFMIGVNFFSDKSQPDLQLAENPIQYEPVRINIQTDLRKEFEVELTQK